jgi:hypothetical protein
MDKVFQTRMSRQAISEILTAFFRKTGYIDRNVSVSVLEVEQEEDTIHIEGTVKEEAIN